MRIGIDTGGTFTDCVVFRRSRVEVVKVFSDRRDTAGSTIEGVRRVAGGSTVSAIIQGTTVGTNALLERSGARVALLTTAGFEDLIEIGRQNRDRLYDLNPRREPPLVARRFRFGVAERIAAEGSILVHPSSSGLRTLATRLRKSGAESVAICLLFSYANPAHERQVARTLGKLGLPLSISHDLLPEFREYERLSTTVINAYLMPRVGEYLRALERAARRAFPLPARGSPRKAGFTTRLYVMQSNGGIATSARAAREPVRTILSGPAGGVVATRWLAKLLGHRKVIGFDMGGTSTDVCLIDGEPRTTRETTLAGLPVAVPVLDVHSVGAGGGSLARFDAGGALRVGPESAGATPGPACYGRGGTRPTITDANVILGRLDPDHFLGGEFRLDRSAAETAFDHFLRASGARAGWKRREELAAGIIAVGNATMEKALRVISVERGHDPRDFSLVCFGGGGGLHAAELAQSLGLARIIVPRNPGAFSAMGVLLSDIVRDISQSVLLPVPERAPDAAVRTARVSNRVRGASSPRSFGQLFEKLLRTFAALEQQTRADLRKDGFEERSARVERRLDVRYQGQSYELSVPFTTNFVRQFHSEHECAYGYADPARPLEVVSARVRLAIPTPKPRIVRQRGAVRSDARDAIIKAKPVWFGGRRIPTPFYDRERLKPGMNVRGPAIITEYSSTTTIPPGFACRVDEYANLILSTNATLRSS